MMGQFGDSPDRRESALLTLDGPTGSEGALEQVVALLALERSAENQTRYDGQWK